MAILKDLIVTGPTKAVGRIYAPQGLEGIADIAIRLGTTNVGDINTPIYLDGGLPKPISLSSFVGRVDATVGASYHGEIFNVYSGTNINKATGQYSHAEGINTSATAYATHAEGSFTTAGGSSSHAEGNATKTTNDYSHAEGYGTEANGYVSHAEGYYSKANGYYTHAEGNYTEATANYSHAEGSNTKAEGQYSHAEGDGSIATRDYSHAEGNHTKAMAEASHTEGRNTVAIGYYQGMHAEGYGSSQLPSSITISSSTDDILTAWKIDKSYDGSKFTLASGNGAHVEGHSTLAFSDGAHAEGYMTFAQYTGSHAEGEYTRAVNSATHTEGFGTTASGNYSHAEGYSNIVAPKALWSETTANILTNWETAIKKGTSYAYTMARGNYSHTEGSDTLGLGTSSHAEGSYTVANGNYSHTEGYWTYAMSDYQHVEGKYNVKDAADKYAFIIGNGTSDDARSNLFAIGWDGKLYINNATEGVDITVDKDTKYTGGTGITIGTDNVVNHSNSITAVTTAGFYKLKYDAQGHVTGTTAVAKSDITALGIPGSDTTYSAGTGLSLSGTTFNHSNSVTAVTTAGLYKVKYDAQGHITGTSAITKADITGLGIPGSDTNTTYTFATGSTQGAFSVTPSGGTAQSVKIYDLGNVYKAATNHASADNKDWNLFTTNGWHMASSAANSPDSNIPWWIAIVSRHDEKYITQDAWSFTDNANSLAKHYVRRMVNSVWGQWNEVKYTDTTYGAEKGISLTSGKFGHSNTAVTAVTAAAFKKVAYDAYGHITATADVAAADLPEHTHNYVPNTEAGVNAAINLLPIGTSAPADGDYYISQYAPNGGTSHLVYYRRPVSKLWDYIKTKISLTDSGTGSFVKNVTQTDGAFTITKGNIGADDLPTSGVTAGGYGPTTDSSPSYGGTFSVPAITVDDKGRITAAYTKTITLPASDNTDEKVTQTNSSGNADYRILFSGTANDTTTTEGARKNTNLKYNPSSKILYTPSMYGNNAKLNSTLYNITHTCFRSTSKEIVIQSGIKWVSSSHMPVVHLYGYAYGLSSPIEMKIGFYIYGDKIGWCGAANMGAWKPDIYLFKYTPEGDTQAYVAIGLVGSIYYPQYAIDVQEEMGGLANVNKDSTFWKNNFYTETGGGNIPTPDSGTTCIKVPYKQILTPAGNLKFKAGTTDVLTYDGSNSSDQTITIASGDTNGQVKVNTTNVTVYTHPTYTAAASGFYKVTVDGTGHVSATTAVTADDLPAHDHNRILAYPAVNSDRRPSNANFATSTNGTGAIFGFIAGGNTSNKPPALSSTIDGNSHIFQMNWDTTAGYDSQFAIYNKNPGISFRTQNAGTWGHWVTITANNPSEDKVYNLDEFSKTDTTYSAGTGLSLSGTTFNHSNSITAVTTAGFKKFTYDSEGHITGSAAVTASDLPAHDHNRVVAVASTTATPGNVATAGHVLFHYNVNATLTDNMPAANNANAIISVSKHNGNYTSQLGFSSNGNLYYRSANGETIVGKTWREIAFVGHSHDNATTSKAGFMSADDKTKLDGIAEGATKVESSSTNGSITINGTATTVYTHPSYTAKTSGLYKVTVDATGHVSAATAVAKADITALGIPDSDTNTTYTIAKGDALGQIKVTPSEGDAYNVTVKGNEAFAYATCSTAAATAAKVVTISNNDNWELNTGSIIVVKFSASNSASNVTLNVNNTGAKSIWYNNAVYTSSSTNQCGYANRYTYYMYDGTYWVWLGQGTIVNDNNYDRIRFQQNILAKTAITSSNIIVANDNTGFFHLKTGNQFDITYPILFASSSISAAANGNNNYLVLALTITTTQALTLTVGKPVFIKGSLSGTKFTPISTAPLTQTIPTSDDGYEYILLGFSYSTTAMYLLPDHPVYAYRGGSFAEVSGNSIADLSIDGQTITYTRGDGSTGTLTTQDTDTTYSAGTGLSLSGTTFNHSNSVTAVTTAGFYKVKYDAQGHVTGTTAVAKSDITGLGIPGSDTTYSAGTGLSLSGTTFNHSNSITAVTTAVFKKFTYDAQGHITGSSAVAASDLPAHTHSYITGHSQGTRLTSANLPTATNGTGSIFGFVATSTMTEGKPPVVNNVSDAHILQMNWDNNGGYDSQIAVYDQKNTFGFRSQSGGTWGNWAVIYADTSSGNKTYNLDTLAGKSTVSISRNLTSGTKIGTITIDGTATDLYCQTNTNTDTLVKQTADSTTTTKVPILMKTVATSGTAGESKYNDNVTITPSTGKVDAKKYGVDSHATMEYDTTANCIKFIFD